MYAQYQERPIGLYTFLFLWKSIHLGEHHNTTSTGMNFIPVEAVSKSMAMMASPFFSRLPDLKSQWQKPSCPRFLDKGLQIRSKLNCVGFIFENVLCSENVQPESEGGHNEIHNSGLVARFHFVIGLLVIIIIIRIITIVIIVIWIIIVFIIIMRSTKSSSS